MRNGAFDYHLEHDRPAEFRLRIVDRPADAATEGGVDDQEARERAMAREGHIFWREALRSPAGKREIGKLLKLSGGFEIAPFAADLSGRQNDRLTDYKMGQLSIGHHIYQLLAICARDELFALQDEMNIHGELAVRPENVGG